MIQQVELWDCLNTILQIQLAHSVTVVAPRPQFSSTPSQGQSKQKVLFKWRFCLEVFEKNVEQATLRNIYI